MLVLLTIILNMMCLANAHSNLGIWQSGKGYWNSNKWISETWNSNKWRSGSWNSNADYSSIVSNHNSYISIVKSNPFVTTSSAYSIVLSASTPTVAPTLEPTILVFIPTLAPNQKTIIFETTSTLSGFPVASLSDQEQTVYIVAFSASIHIDSEMVKIVKQEIANRRLTYNIDVTTRITYPYVSDPQSTYNLLVQEILKTATNFTDLLKSVALKMGIESFSNVSVIGVQVSPLLNYVDDKIGTITPRHQLGILLIVIITISASSVFVALIVYLYKQKWGRNFDRLLNLQRISKYFTNEKCINEVSINEVWGIESCVTEGPFTDGPFTDGPASNSILSIVD